MPDLSITLTIKGQLGQLADLAPFLRDLDAQGVQYTLTLSEGDWQRTYTSNWREALEPKSE